jgi:hypothetical protein
VPRYRLRYQATDLELPVGDFVIGRSSSCNLALDDALVSRRHATIHVTADAVTVEDLGSRNGVLVNGEKIKGTVSLSHLDRVSIGSQDLVLLEVGRGRKSQHDTGASFRCRSCGSALPPEDSFCRACGASVQQMSMRTLAGQTIEMKAPEDVIDPEDVTRQATGFSLLAGIADKALALGRFDEAQRMLEKHLIKLVERAAAPDKPKASTVHKGTSYALKLARGLHAPRWVDWVFSLYTAMKTVPTSEAVDELYDLVRVLSYDNPRELRSYLAVVRPMRDRLTPSEKFVLQRLEGLERVITA